MCWHVSHLLFARLFFPKVYHFLLMGKHSLISIYKWHQNNLNYDNRLELGQMKIIFFFSPSFHSAGKRVNCMRVQCFEQNFQHKAIFWHFKSIIHSSSFDFKFPFSQMVYWQLFSSILICESLRFNSKRTVLKAKCEWLDGKFCFD